jgi:hypothetical protein
MQSESRYIQLTKPRKFPVTPIRSQPVAPRRDADAGRAAILPSGVQALTP